MPYFIYRKMRDEERSKLESSIVYEYTRPTRASFLSRADAFAVLKRTEHHTTHEVIWIPDISEQRTWQQRERAKLSNGTYVAVPWSDVEVDRDETWRHFAHVAVKDPSKVAFTETAEKGHLDKHTVMTPGRYLERYYPNDSAQHAEWIDAFKAIASGELKFADTAAKATTVYLNGPSSCMDGSHYSGMKADNGSDFPHPASVYTSPGQLRVVYYGPLTSPSQRAVVWPERKQYVRIYGSGPLEAILKRHGYSKVDYFDGATIARIPWTSTRRSRGKAYQKSVVLPYIDSGDCLQHQQESYYANSNATSDTLTLSCERSGEQSFCCQCCDGFSYASMDGARHDDDSVCDRCGDPCDPDCTWCDSCYENRWTCDRCSECFFADDESSNDVGDESWCDACVESETCTCEWCNDTWLECGVFAYQARQARRRNGLDHLCADCASHATRCDGCSNLYDSSDHDQCPHCPRAADTDTRPLPFDEESEPYVGDSDAAF